jgi:release factor glutamine methyltransferase
MRIAGVDVPRRRGVSGYLGRLSLRGWAAGGQSVQIPRNLSWRPQKVPGYDSRRVRKCQATKRHVSIHATEQQAWTIEAVLRWAADDFRSRGTDSPRLDAELLLAHAIGSTRINLVVESKRGLEPAELGRFRELVRRRRAREPVAYILGHREFYGRIFRVDSRVLIPRPDTETLIDVALHRTRGVALSMRALDLCTGSGCVAITLARERPTSRVLGTDISDAAIVVARDNALRLGAYNTAFATGDLFSAVVAPLQFDVIVANPPYVPSGEITTLAPEIRDYEPRAALDGGFEGLTTLRRIVADARGFLARSGVLAVEVGAGEAAAALELFERAGFVDLEVARDCGRIERVVSGVL